MTRRLIILVSLYHDRITRLVRVLTSILVISILTIGSITVTTSDVDASSKGKVKVFSYSTKPAMDSMKVSWKKQKRVTFYKLYRMDITKSREKDSFSPKKKSYKFVVKIAGKG